MAELAEHVEQVLRARQVAGLDGGRARVQQLLRPPRVPVGSRSAALGTALLAAAGTWPVLLGAAALIADAIVGSFVRRRLALLG